MITRKKILDYVAQQYGIEPGYPWQDKPQYAVLRHAHPKQKWFAVLMTISADKIGLPSNEMVEIINLKGEPAAIDGLRQSRDIFPAYHMNKTHWFSLRLNSQFPEQECYHLIDWSFDLTQ